MNNKDLPPGLTPLAFEKHADNITKQYNQLCLDDPILMASEVIAKKYPGIPREVVLMELVINYVNENAKLLREIVRLNNEFGGI